MWQLARDARYYSAAVVEEEGVMCAVVLASKLAEVREPPLCAQSGLILYRTPAAGAVQATASGF